MKRLIGGMALVMLGLVLAKPGWAAPQQQIAYDITYPTDGMTVSGVVEIRGSARHSSSHWWYNVSYSPGPQETATTQWVQLVFVENMPPVDNGTLAIWDTTTVPNGVYVIALTVYGEGDQQYWQKIVRNLTVNNAQPVATPGAEQPTPESTMPTVGAGVTPTMVSVEQPATSTPRPTTGEGEEEVPGAASPGESEESDVLFDAGALRGAFCTGGQITLMMLLLWGLYVTTKALIRWYLRQSKLRPPR